MTNAHWTPKISIEAAHKWLNIDTYWASQHSDPGDTDTSVSVPPLSSLTGPVYAYPAELTKKYPLVNQSGQPRQSRLHDPQEPDLRVSTIIEQLINQLREELFKSNWAEAQAKIDQIENICRSLSKNNRDADPLQIVEARLEFGLAYYLAGEHAKAIEQLELCIKSFANDAHAEAVARWIAGYIQLERPHIYLNQGLVNWQRSWELFTQAATNGNRVPKSQVEWYSQRAKLMFDDLQAALTHGGIQPQVGFATAPPPAPVPTPTPPPPQPTPVPPAPTPPLRPTGPRPAPKPSMKPAVAAVLAVLPIVHSELHAGAAGVVVDEIEEYAATQEVSINGVPHSFYRFDGTSAPLELKPGHQYRIARVEGDSMDQVVAPGDYVVLALPGDVPLNPEPGDIVAVETSVEESDEPDTLATLKEWRPVANDIELRPRSFNPEHRPQVYPLSSVRVRALAIGKLSPRTDH